MQFDLPFMVIAAIVMGMTGIFSLIVSFAAVKLNDNYFILGSLGFLMIAYTILYNWTDVTFSPYGIPRIKILRLWDISGVWGYFVLTILLSAGVIWFFRRI